MGPNFDLRVSIHPNPGNSFMAIFVDLGLAYSPLKSTRLSCSSEVTLCSFYARFFLLNVESCSLTLKSFLNKYDKKYYLNWKCNSDKIVVSVFLKKCSKTFMH